MRIAGFKFAAVRSKDFAGAVGFFAEVLGLLLERRDDEREFAEFRLPSGQGLGVFGPKSAEYSFHSCPVIGFDVEDVRSARHKLEAKGVKFVSEIFEAANGEAWAYFRGPDDFIFEVWHPAAHGFPRS